MKRIVLILLILYSDLATAQDEMLFKVITYSDGVTIDGVPVSAGMDVSGPGKKVVIPSKGYMGVILKSGDLAVMTDSRPAGSVGLTRKITAPGAVHAGLPDVEILGVGIHEYRILIGDSIFFNWRPSYRNISDTATIRFANIFDEEIETRTVVGNYAVLDLKGMFDKDKSLLISVECETTSNGRVHSDQLLLRKDLPDLAGRISFDLSRLPASEDRLFLESALYFLDSDTYDASWCLYKIFKSKKTTADPILAAYYKLMFNKYQLENVKLD